MTTDDRFKASATYSEHLDGSKESKDSRDFIELAEGVQYGYSGARAFLTSPYVFGAALLASMGGFSYGYGMNPIVHRRTVSLSDPFLRPGCHLAHPRNGTISLPISGGRPVRVQLRLQCRSTFHECNYFC